MKKVWPGLFLAVSAASLAIVVACSSSEDRPDAADDPAAFDSGPGPNADASATDGGDGGDGGDASVPPSCVNTKKDEKETDVDCGGSECPKCIDGKSCIAATDCAGGSCVSNKCVTAACNDVVTNGTESDVDCGGDTCSRCTIGKRCKVGADCVSGTCNNEACACPVGMAPVARAGGGAYCVDQVEVTKGQYNKFITANVNVADQDPVCQPPANTTFVPRGAWPPATDPGGAAFNLSLPVHYVDWCDAAAYCKWAGKQLCGKINGGSLDLATADQADAGAWYNACSAQGSLTYPYSNVFDPAKCNGRVPDGGQGPVPQGLGYGYGGANQDIGVYQTVSADTAGNFTTFVNTSCQGGSTNLFQMSGNVAEWEDACDGAGPTANCRVRGGSWRESNDPSGLACNDNRTEQRLPPAGNLPDQDPLRDLGIRCCLY